MTRMLSMPRPTARAVSGPWAPSVPAPSMSRTPQQTGTYMQPRYPDRIAFFVDGVNYFTVWNDGTGWESWPFNHNFHIILNLAVGGDWGGAQGVDPIRARRRRPDLLHPQVNYLSVQLFSKI